jgi:hypothetical protein
MPIAITVEDSFLLAGRGLVLAPSLPVPEGGSFQGFADEVALHRPDGTIATVRATFSITHSLQPSGLGRWEVVAVLPLATKGEVPVGTEVHVSNETMARLSGRQP